MRKIALLSVFLCFAASLAFAETGAMAPATMSAEVTIQGVIIDNACAGTKKPEELAAFVKTHTKECALMPACVASGYSIFADGKLTKFDKASNAKIEEFLKKSDSKLDVVVVAKKTGGILSLVSIKNK